ncbi:MAG TPA: polysaccharide deacetylase family protein [Abditibacteriaceae bacterium]|jgi:peptidoglycan/xylan/chitin deacetylase (PgdA/CDA1 family)
MLLEGHSTRIKFQRSMRYGLFALLTVAIWGAYFMWRPPGPTLGLRHVTHWGDQPVVSLTFDDGPHPLMTPLLLAALKRTDVKATFFVVGDGLRLYPELAYRMAHDGHQLANHSQYHYNLTRISPAEYEHEIENCFGAIRHVYKVAGLKDNNTKLFRPPGGGLNRAAMDYLYRNDVTLAWWSNNVGDWARPPAWKVWRGVSDNLRPGDIILLHDAGVGTPQAIPGIVKSARRHGLSFLPMPEAQP